MSYLEELHTIRLQITLSLLALKGILALEYKRGTSGLDYLEAAVNMLGVAHDDLEFAIKRLGVEND